MPSARTLGDAGNSHARGRAGSVKPVHCRAGGVLVGLPETAGHHNVPRRCLGWGHEGPDQLLAL
eukprot:3311286-Alexandrium_andersonii.AAC.1